MREFGIAFEQCQAEWDNRMPPDESPIMVCNGCKKEYNQDTQELDDFGKGLCDGCVESHNSKVSSGSKPIL
jgi:hypothetical protein